MRAAIPKVTPKAVSLEGMILIPESVYPPSLAGQTESCLVQIANGDLGNGLKNVPGYWDSCHQAGNDSSCPAVYRSIYSCPCRYCTGGYPWVYYCKKDGWLRPKCGSSLTLSSTAFTLHQRRISEPLVASDVSGLFPDAFVGIGDHIHFQTNFPIIFYRTGIKLVSDCSAKG